MRRDGPDRYRGYVDALPLEHQYCYVHLLRDVKDMEPQFPDDPEIATFSSDLKHALKKAIKLCSQEVTANEYIRQAGQIKEEILMTVMHTAAARGYEVALYLKDCFDQVAAGLPVDPLPFPA